jgi:hypothetical protein
VNQNKSSPEGQEPRKVESQKIEKLKAGCKMAKHKPKPGKDIKKGGNPDSQGN